MTEYDPSLGPLSAPDIQVDEADKFNPAEANRRAEMFARLARDLASFIEPRVKARLNADSEFSNVDVMVARARKTMQMIDQIGETAQDEVPS